MNKSEIKEKINLNTINWQHILTTNCYAFALGLDVQERKIISNAYQPGRISNHKLNDYFTLVQLINAVESDLDYLDINYREIEPTSIIEEDEWKVALFVQICKQLNGIFILDDFHFLRQIGDDWYHKPGYFGKPTDTDSSNQKIIDPTKCNIHRKIYQKTYALNLKKN